ncbi:MAG: T9SS type A sorting domain-containing protein [Paludibacter sp.]
MIKFILKTRNSVSFKNSLSLISLIFLLCPVTSSAQEIVGVPLHLGKGITKSVNEIIEFGKKNESNELNEPLRDGEELELPPPKMGTIEPAWNISRWPISKNLPNGVSSGLPAPNIWSNFLATDFSSASGGWPPDNNGDVGTTQVFISQNFRFKVYPKPNVTAAAVTTPNGSSIALLASPVMDISVNSFFGTAFAGVITTDPHIRFDRLTNRWFIVAQSTNESTNNFLLFAVSSGATIAGTASFTFFRVSMSTIGGADAGKFLDYPTLGIDKNSLYLGANIFSNKVAGTYQQSSLYVVNKAAMISGTLTLTPFPAAGNATASNNILTPQGVQNDNPNATEGYFAGESSWVFNRLVMKRITYSGTTPILSADINVTVPANQNAIGQAAQGSSGTLDAVGRRFYAAMLMENKITGASTLWLAETLGVNSSGVSAATISRNASRWLEIQNLTTTPVLNQAGTLFDNAATNPRGFWVPSIAMNGQGHAVMVSSTAAANANIDINVAGRYRTTALGTLVDTVMATIATDNYNPINGGSFVNRWGDYSQVTIDPNDNMTFWAFQEYCNSTNSYGVRAIQIKAPPPATPSLATVPGCGASVAVTINGTSTNNSEFFDPGADAGGPGFTRLTVTCSGGITVSGTTFVSPTQITCFLDTRGKASGTYTITVTNPDGQTATTNFSLVSSCPLPVTLITFNGNLVNNETHLNWRTASENNLKSYEIEKSMDGFNFALLNVVAAKGNANTETSYQGIDRYPYPGYSYYRLKMMDKDAGFTYSNIVKIETEKKSIALTKMYPNPLHDIFNIEIFAERKSDIQIRVYDLLGKSVLNKQVAVQAGLNEYPLNLTSLSAGNYIIEIKDMSGSIIGKSKLVKQ